MEEAWNKNSLPNPDPLSTEVLTRPLKYVLYCKYKRVQVQVVFYYDSLYFLVVQPQFPKCFSAPLFLPHRDT